jgi:GNAT superfamily N-acetyltransferase
VKAFRRKGTVFVASFLPEEARMLTQLAAQVAELLETRADSSPDAALKRLLPEAYRGDPEAAAEFRRFTSDDLAGRKVANARVLIESVREAAAATSVTKVTLDAAEALAWIRALTDIRLSIGARLGIETDDAVLDQGEPMVEVYNWLGFAQESLVVLL